MFRAEELLEYPKIERELSELLFTYSEIADSNPNKLRSLIPPSEMWRFIIDGGDQGGKKLDFSASPDFFANCMNISLAALDKENPLLLASIRKIYNVSDEAHLSQFTPAELLAIDKTIFPYEFGEPGYTEAMAQALTVVFNPSFTLNSSFIKKLHSLATENVKSLLYKEFPEDKKGEFRDTPQVSFNINNKNCTPEGIAEFLENSHPSNKISLIFDEGTHLILSLTLIEILRASSAQTKKDPSKSLVSSPDLKEFAPYYNASKAVQQLFFDLSETKDIQSAGKIIYQHAIEEDSYSIRVTSTQLTNTRLTLTICIDTLIARYLASSAKAKTPLEKLSNIISFIQSAEQLHPFLDGNCRTFYILLNVLLVHTGFPPTILINPNRLDLFSKKQLMRDIINGAKNIFTLIKTKKLYNVQTSDVLNYLSSSTAPHIRALYLYFKKCISIEENDRNSLITKLSVFNPRSREAEAGAAGSDPVTLRIKKI